MFTLIYFLLLFFFSIKKADRKQNQTKVDNKDKADVTDEIYARTGSRFE